LSAATVKTHLQRIYDQLGVSDRTSAVVVALRRGLLD
jgi:two-component system nitrate/nitrite response regulator NarL